MTISSKRMFPLKDLVDLEVQLAQDRDADGEELRVRDRRIFQNIQAATDQANVPSTGQVNIPSQSSSQAEKAGRLSAWLEALRRENAALSIGASVSRAFKLMGLVLGVIGFVGGWSTAALLLHFESGGTPVNVLWFLALTIGGQVGLLALGLISFLLYRLFPGLGLFSVVPDTLRGLIAWMRRYITERSHRRIHQTLTPEAQERIRVAAAWLNTRARLYRPVESWLILGLVQRFGVAFNVGVLLCCLRLIFFTDLAFSWSTTVAAMDAYAVHALAEWTALPWGWLFPDAVPGLDLVKASQFFRLENKFFGAGFGSRGNAMLVSGWWRFLVAAVVVYGLMPRLAFLGIAKLGLRNALRNLPFDSADIAAIFRRMYSPVFASPPQGSTQDLPDPTLPQVERQAPLSGMDEKKSLVIWRDVPLDPQGAERLVAEHFGGNLQHFHKAGGHDFDLDRQVADAVAQREQSVVVVAEAWEPPDKAFRRFVEAIRKARSSGPSAGKSQTIYVALLGQQPLEQTSQARASQVDDVSALSTWPAPDEADTAVWRDRMTLLQDPYLTVSPVDLSP